MGQEMIVNLWAVYDAASGFVYGLAGRAYCVEGTDQEKLSILKRLSGTDYATAKRYEVPPRFSVTEVGGSTTTGLAPLSAVNDPNVGLFNDMFKNIEHELPLIPDFSSADSKGVVQNLPDDPLCSVTILYEDEAGAIRPIITDEDNRWFVEQEKKRGRNFD